MVHLTPRSGVLVAAWVLSTAIAQAAPTGFLDTSVAPGDYVGFTLHTDASVSLAKSALATGNPGAALAIDYTNQGGAVNLVSLVGLIYNGFNWSPSTDGALASVAFTNDRYVDGGDPFINTNLVTFSRALVLQGGRYYLSALFDVGQAKQAWYTTADSSLEAFEFIEVDPSTGLTDATQHPDFSTSGGTLQFGVLNRFTRDSVGTPTNLNVRFAYDNIGFTMNPVQVVPEPAGTSLLAAAMVALALTQRRAARARPGPMTPLTV
jgi:hypothetical protein